MTRKLFAVASAAALLAISGCAKQRKMYPAAVVKPAPAVETIQGTARDAELPVRSDRRTPETFTKRFTFTNGNHYFGDGETVIITDKSGYELCRGKLLWDDEPDEFGVNFKSLDGKTHVSMYPEGFSFQMLDDNGAQIVHCTSTWDRLTLKTRRLLDQYLLGLKKKHVKKPSQTDAPPSSLPHAPV